MHVANLDEIKGALAGLDLRPAIEAGFVADSGGRDMYFPAVSTSLISGATTRL